MACYRPVWSLPVKSATFQEYAHSPARSWESQLGRVRPENLLGLTSRLLTPAYSTSVGLLYWALLMSKSSLPSKHRNPLSSKGLVSWEKLLDWFKKVDPIVELNLFAI